MKITAVLIAVIAVIGAGIWYFFLRKPAQPEQTENILIHPSPPVQGIQETEPQDMACVGMCGQTVVSPMNYMGEAVTPMPEILVARPYDQTVMGYKPMPIVKEVEPTQIKAPTTSTELKQTLNTAIVSAVAVSPPTTGTGAIDAVKTIVNMNLAGVAADGSCKLGYYKNPFGICQTCQDYWNDPEFVKNNDAWIARNCDNREWLRNGVWIRGCPPEVYDERKQCGGA